MIASAGVPILSIMEPGLSIPANTAPSSQPAADLCDPRVAEEQHVWPPTVSRTPPAILQPLSFPETRKEDLSLFTDPSKDQPIYCLVCDLTFSSRHCDSNISEQTQNLVLSETIEEKSDRRMGVALEKEEVEGGKREERVRGKEESKVLSLQPKDEWLRHLLLEHKIVVHQVSEICSLKWYEDKQWRIGGGGRGAQGPVFPPLPPTVSLPSSRNDLLALLNSTFYSVFNIEAYQTLARISKLHQKRARK